MGVVVDVAAANMISNIRALLSGEVPPPLHDPIVRIVIEVCNRDPDTVVGRIAYRQADVVGSAPLLCFFALAFLALPLLLFTDRLAPRFRDAFESLNETDERPVLHREPSRQRAAFTAACI